jgi:hypothetical protein
MSGLGSFVMGRRLVWYEGISLSYEPASCISTVQERCLLVICGFLPNKKVYAVVHLVEALRYKPVDRGFDSRWCQLIFFFEIILPVALCPWGRLSL